ncbi:MAG: hypothetical protein J7484_15170 [Microbacterium sp.]|nr:hypothetical protein [Microbacterium sp.]
MYHWSDASAKEREAAKAAYLASLPDLLRRFEVRSAASGGPQLKDGVAALPDLIRWFGAELPRADSPDGPLPTWWNPATPLRGEPNAEPRMQLSRGQLALIDETAAFLAQILLDARPDVRWVIYRGSRSDIRNGATWLAVGPRPTFKGDRTTLSPRTLFYKLAKLVLDDPAVVSNPEESLWSVRGFLAEPER